LGVSLVAVILPFVVLFSKTVWHIGCLKVDFGGQRHLFPPPPGFVERKWRMVAWGVP